MQPNLRTKYTQMLANVLVTDAATVSCRLDLAGADWASIEVNMGIEETSSATGLTVALYELDTTTFATTNLLSSALHDNETARQHVFLVEQCRSKRKRYLFLKMTAGTGTGNDMWCNASAQTGRIEQEPSNTTVMVSGGTNDVCAVIV